MEEVTAAKLNRQDWIAIGLQTLINRGIEAVRIEPLAKLLSVSRGSFYWHFKNRDDLLEAMLQQWEMFNTDHIIKNVEELDSNPRNKLLRLLEIAAQDDDQLEKAVRIWAANDFKAEAMISRVDQRRLDYLQNLFIQIGFSGKDAKVRAQVAYSVRLGWFIMIPSVKSLDRLEEIRLVYMILIQPSNPV
jgi:AcrR family transcriptional regulator